jgi:CheY-like chemotaxis protein
MMLSVELLRQGALNYAVESGSAGCAPMIPKHLSASSSRMSACHILCVEDNDDDAGVFRDILRRLVPSADVVFVRDATEASVFLKQEEPFAGVARPDMIIADCELSGESGLELLEWVRSHPRLREIPFVVFCGVISQADGERARQLGATHILQKPIGHQELTQAFRESLRKGPLKCYPGE